MASLILLLWTGAGIVFLLKTEKFQHWLAFATSAAAFALALWILPQETGEVEIWQDWGGTFGALSFRADGLALMLGLLALGIGSLCILFSWDYMAGHPQLGRYYALVLLFIGAMLGLVLTNSFLLLFFFWELTALCSYALIAFESDSPQAAAGGTRALIITQVGGLGLLFAALLVYQHAGNYEISQFLGEAGAYPSILAFGIILAAAAKSAQVPFQSWLAGAMEAPTPISALIHAATMVNAGVYLLIRLYPAFETVPYWKETVMGLGMVTALMAAVLALSSHDLKAVLAYSTVSQLAYMIYAVGLGALEAASLHLLSHAIFKALLFLSAGAIIHNLHTRDMREMGGLWGKMPFVRAMLLIGAAALVGLPIANGFWTKEYILEAGLEHGAWTYWFMLLGVALTAAYSFRMLSLVLFGEAKTMPAHGAGTAMKISLMVLALGVFISPLLNAPLLNEAQSDVLFEPFFVPATYAVLAVIGLGAFMAWQRQAYIRMFVAFRSALETEFGFTSLNVGIVSFTKGLANGLSRSQTGQLNWNILGILFALVLLLVWKGAAL